MDILRFSEYIKEQSEFQLNNMNPSGMRASVHVDNPNLSLNAFDKRQTLINMSLSRINDITKNIRTTHAYGDYRSKLLLEEQRMESFAIQRIVKTNSNKFNVYFITNIQGVEYWGVVEDIMGDKKVKSEIFKSPELILSKEWIIMLKGQIVEVIEDFLSVKKGEYELLDEEVKATSMVTGEMIKFKKGIEVEVVKSNKDNIIVEYKNERYKLVYDNFIYFNWWWKNINE